MKKCIKCKKTKPFSEFNKNKRIKDGYHYYCRLCKNKMALYDRQVRLKKGLCVKCGSVSAKRLCLSCLEKRKSYDKTEHAMQLNRCRASKANKKRTEQGYYQKYLSNRYNNDIQFRIASCLRSRLYQAIKREIKLGSAVNDLGCSIEEFKVYLESQFQPGMSWENYGNGSGYTKWNIDHIIPLNTVDLTDREQFLKVCHYTNLRPMWQCENISRNKKIK